MRLFACDLATEGGTAEILANRRCEERYEHPHVFGTRAKTEH